MLTWLFRSVFFRALSVGGAELRRDVPEHAGRFQLQILQRGHLRERPQVGARRRAHVRFLPGRVAAVEQRLGHSVPQKRHDVQKREPVLLELQDQGGQPELLAGGELQLRLWLPRIRLLWRRQCPQEKSARLDPADLCHALVRRLVCHHGGHSPTPDEKGQDKGTALGDDERV